MKKIFLSSLVLISILYFSSTAYAWREYYIPDEKMLENFEQVVELYISHPLLQTQVDTLLERLSKRPWTMSWSSEDKETVKKYDYATVLKEYLRHYKNIHVLQSHWPLHPIQDRWRTMYMGEVKLTWTLTVVYEKRCTFYGIHYRNEELCILDWWNRTDTKLYAFNTTQPITPYWDQVIRILPENSSSDSILFDFTHFKDTFQIIPQWKSLRVVAPKLQKWQTQQFMKHADTWDEVTLSFLKNPVWPAMYFSDLDVMRDIALSK
jgi:hypothetical protein